MINKSLKYDTELMIITMEECGELIEACSKAIRCENYKDERLTEEVGDVLFLICLLYTSPSPRDLSASRMPSSA